MNKLKQLLNDYVQTRLDLFKIEIQESLAKLLLSVISGLIFLICFAFGSLFLSIALAHLFNYLLASQIFGYLIVGAIYICIGLFLTSKKVKKLIIDKIGESINKSMDKADLTNNIDLDGN